MKKNIQTRIAKRKLRIRSKISGSENRPRLSVFRSNRYIYAQLIDDVKGVTLLSVSEKELPKDSINKKMKKNGKASILGQILAQKAIKRKIKTIVFDRNRYKYHGRIKALAESVREGGLKF
ncbi:50S ribosomal protein L18 [Candidatus Gottesmanbacteria bacterium RBG_13_37_7]|uniref:Large ribosomal subunit protein uL18 n=1 Tax=Candidatus Gottesmanbacteria bacterium RBG_13_37_7 TaxID=1798369 RepID=A0A1F5YJR9_9BACT|nr:MAG: 50S ribosomal protein L18 [Candidatus Gottesmanbacteria bacterium RBG_13_37_7]